ncbi:hypothetical protein TWF730_002786 [Orbilia blumenaviensis]|uniref:DUF7582 domain-containing protein n=1 Tax=Orbilia blumenaviensis TaxID=1796055 RepID=A0AAV9U755_9PEZI
MKPIIQLLDSHAFFNSKKAPKGDRKNENRPMGPSQSREQRRLRRHRTPRPQQQQQPGSQPEPQEREGEGEEEVDEQGDIPDLTMSFHHSTTSSTPYAPTPTPPLRTPSFGNSSNTGGRRSRQHHNRHQPQLQTLTIPSSSSPQPYQLNSGIDTPTLTTALSYISARMLQKTKSHHTFIVTGSVLFSLFFRSKAVTRSVSLLQTSGLSGKEKDVLISAVLRASEKFGIEREDWVNNGGEREVMRFGMGGGGEDLAGGSGSGWRRGASGEVDEVVARSLGQNAIVFSGDGMTLYAVDFLYELRRGLHLLSTILSGGEQSREVAGEGGEDDQDEVDIEDMVELVRRLVAVEGKGRRLRRSVVEGRYGRLVFSDYAWETLGFEYERRFGEKGLKDEDEESDGEDTAMGSGERGDGESVWTYGS